MRIFDCFIFSNEIDLLRLRLTIMGPYVDGFLVVEGNQTFTGMPREFQYPMYAEELPHRDKIEYVPVSEFPNTNSAWDREHFLRDQIRLNVPADSDDIILISDADEIINLPVVLQNYDKEKPSRIELTTFYHFLDVQSSEKIRVNLISPFSCIKNVPIGDRNTYESFAPSIILDRNGNNGGHFTYMYGYDTDRYAEKIHEFSHQELNTPYYTDRDRLLKCVAWDLDLFERDQFRYTQVSLKRVFPDMANALLDGLSNLPIKSAIHRHFGEGLRRYIDGYYWRRKYHQYRYVRARFKRRCLSLVGK